MELPPFNEEDFKRYQQQNSITKDCDMDPEMLSEAKDHISGGIEKFTGVEGCDLLSAAKYTKENMDNYFGPTWHCIIGEGFSFEVTTMQGSKLMMYYAGNLGVLLFKC